MPFFRFISLHKVSDKRMSGISFLEVIIVIFLIAVISGISLPNFVRMATSSVELEARKLSNTLRDLQALSILTSKDIRLELDSRNNQMQILTRNSKLEWVMHPKFPEPIPLLDGVRIKSVYEENRTGSTVGGLIHVNFLPSGYIDIFNVEFYDDEYSIKIQTEGVMGKVLISDVNQNVQLL